MLISGAAPVYRIVAAGACTVGDSRGTGIVFLALTQTSADFVFAHLDAYITPPDYTPALLKSDSTSLYRDTHFVQSLFIT